MTKETVHCYVFDTLADWEHGFAVAGINNTQFHRVSGQWRVQTVARRAQPVVSTRKPEYFAELVRLVS